MPLPKGRTNNPNGRPVGSTNKDNPLKILCREATPESFLEILKIAQSGESSDRLKAATWICEQAYGKASQAVEVGGKGGGALKAVLRIIAKDDKK